MKEGEGRRREIVAEQRRQENREDAINLIN